MVVLKAIEQGFMADVKMYISREEVFELLGQGMFYVERLLSKRLNCCDNGDWVIYLARDINGSVENRDQ